MGNKFGRPGYNDTYDYIIVGGGQHGSVLANRLSIGTNYSVALLEAGNFYEIMDGNRTQIPGLAYINNVLFPVPDATTGTSYGLMSVPQPGYNNREILTVTAHTFGGATAANNMAYQRPTVGTWDWIADLTGDDFWTWDNCWAAFKKSCNFYPPNFEKIDPANNITWDPNSFDEEGGPLSISYGNYFAPGGRDLQASFDSLGFDNVGSAFDGRLRGYNIMGAALNPILATRDSSETSFIQEATREGDITVYPNALVERVTFDGDKKATGVDVMTNFAYTQKRYHLTARKEVILSAGVWYSPQLLMLSGIGPAATLEEHDIEVLVDLPGVGQNVWDQPLMIAQNQISTVTGTQYQVGNPDYVEEVDRLYYEEQAGPLSASGFGLATGWEKFVDYEAASEDFSDSTKEWLASFPEDWPDTEFVFLDNADTDSIAQTLGRPIESDENFFVGAVCLLSTKARGNVTIKSNNILDRPLINPNWFGEPEDVEMAYHGYTRLREIMRGMESHVAEIIPGPELESREEVTEFLRNTARHIYHGLGSNKMGADDDELAVLDSRARVRGVTGLRVVDASSFPISPPGHPMSSMYMFAEKIAESILDGN
jgi:choline dehydrogenase